ncbi:hypothetical protein [Aequorivita flava]|uniref:Uncharacterized protein n=1 Tax=Aequorivita flava TaxID=3114371 RepID=A0AB35YT80_9FLAO
MHLTIGKILKEYKEYLTDYEIEQLRKVQRGKTDFAAQVKQLQLALFAEEWDFMMDSASNPMSQEATNRVNRKRKAFGMNPVDASGFGAERSSKLFCEEVVRHTKNYNELL